MVHGIGPTGPVEGPKEPHRADVTRIITWEPLRPTQNAPREVLSAYIEATALKGINDRLRSNT